MKFVEIVEVVESIESKLENLSDEKLNLLDSMLSEGSETSFDVEHHIDYLVEFVESYSEEQATLIAETVDCGSVLDKILESARKHTNDTNSFLVEAKEKVEKIGMYQSPTDEKKSITLLSIVTNKLTEMMGESAVEALPAEMVFDIANATKALNISDDAPNMEITSLVEEISNKLESAINRGKIDFDSDDYTGETLAEFLDDYSDTEDLLAEMMLVNDSVLSESSNKVAARILGKAKQATVLVEGKYENCPPGDVKCKAKKAKAAKEWFSKNELPGGGNVEDFAMSKLSGKLRKHVLAASKAAQTSTGKPLPKDYIQYVLVPGIIKRMRIKNKKMNAKAHMKKQGMR